MLPPEGFRIKHSTSISRFWSPGFSRWDACRERLIRLKPGLPIR